MRTSTGSFFLSPSYGDDSAHDDRLHLFAWLCDHSLARHAHGVARAPSSHILLAHRMRSGCQNITLAITPSGGVPCRHGYAPLITPGTLGTDSTRNPSLH